VPGAGLAGCGQGLRAELDEVVKVVQPRLVLLAGCRLRLGATARSAAAAAGGRLAQRPAGVVLEIVGIRRQHHSGTGSASVDRVGLLPLLRLLRLRRLLLLRGAG
jgi:hypothetical protein